MEWWGAGFSLFWVFPLLCMVAMVFMMVRMWRGGGCMPMGRSFDQGPSGTRETPQQILQRRLAAGEITPEQYSAIRRELESAGGFR